MSLFTDRELREMRALQAKGMGDRCKVQRTVAGGLNEVTGQYGAPTATTIYEGVCRVAPTTSGQPTVVGQEEVVYRQTDVFLPHDAPVPREDDIIVVTRAEHDPDMVGRVFRIVDVRLSSNNNARKVSCTNLQPSDNTPQV